MSSIWFVIVLQFSVIACGMVSGVFLTFSDFVMRSLNGSKTSAGVEVMQVINREVFRSVFMFLLLGMSALSLFLIGYAYFYLTGPASALIITGSVIYLIGMFAVTLIFNVPMNNRLDIKEYTEDEAAAYWTNTYYPRWTFWNHVRTLASSAASICFLVAYGWLAQGITGIG